MVEVWATYRVAGAIQIFLIRFCFSGVEIKKKKKTPTVINNYLAVIVFCLLFIYPSSLKEVH